MGYYLKKYGNRNVQMFQEGGAMPAEGGAPPAPEAAPQGGGPDEQQLIALAEAATQGDQQAAMELGMALAPMIMEQAAAMGGEAPAGGGAPPPPAPEEGGTPVFRRGGTFLAKV